MKSEKYKLLREGIIYDLIGMGSMFIPVVGEFFDIIWAPIAARKMTRMYKGTQGKIASVIVFLEEILPYTDIIPTFTLMWFYTYVWKKQPAPEVMKMRMDD